MATEGFKRKLTAVFSADIMGYSRLMGEDESATVKTLEDYNYESDIFIEPGSPRRQKGKHKLQ